MAENIDLPRIGRNHPPVHILVASYMGIRPSEKPSEADEAEAVNMLGGNTLSEEEFNALLKAKGII